MVVPCTTNATCNCIVISWSDRNTNFVLVPDVDPCISSAFDAHEMVVIVDIVTELRLIVKLI